MDLSNTGYEIFARVDYNQKTWIYGLTSESEYGEFLMWAGGEEHFAKEIEEGARINLIDATGDFI
jgi:hypothetical protein